MENFAYIKAKESVELLIDEELLGIKIYLIQQKKEIGTEDIEIDGYIAIDIENPDNVKVEYLSSFQILKRKIMFSVYTKSK